MMRTELPSNHWKSSPQPHTRANRARVKISRPTVLKVGRDIFLFIKGQVHTRLLAIKSVDFFKDSGCVIPIEKY